MSYVHEAVIDSCGAVVASLTADLESMRQSTEQSALSIGELLIKIVNSATDGNREVEDSLKLAIDGSKNDGDDKSAAIDTLIRHQVETVTEVIRRTQGFFEQNVELAKRAAVSSEQIRRTADEVSELMSISRLLALNLRIEASRMGDKGSGFAALGKEVQDFSTAVGVAANKIQTAADALLQTIPKMQNDNLSMRDEMTVLAESFETEMETVTERTMETLDALRTTRDQTAVRNNQILEYSNETLSYLAFQDPVSQGLSRAKHNVMQLYQVVCGEEPEFCSLATLREEIGEDGSRERETGLVELF